MAGTAPTDFQSTSQLDAGLDHCSLVLPRAVAAVILGHVVRSLPTWSSTGGRRPQALLG